MQRNIIEIRNVYKKFNDVEALSDVSFDVKENEIFGIIGPDGAGKTTLFRILCTLLNPTAGSVKVTGLDVIMNYKNIRSILGYMPGRFSLYQDLSVKENIEFFASLFGTTLEKNHHRIEGIYKSIERFQNRKAGNLSGGMKQKLALCCTLIHQPRILILDEPTTGVDPVSRNEFWNILKDIRNTGVTIVASTPYMDEASQCDRVAMINNGKILTIETPEGIVSKFDKPLFGIKAQAKYELLLELQHNDKIATCYPCGEYNHIIFTDGNTNIKCAELKEELIHKGFQDIIISPIKADIEDCFIKLSRQ